MGMDLSVKIYTVVLSSTDKTNFYFTQNLSMLSKDNNKVDGQSSKSEIIFVLWKASHERFITISFEKHYSIL